MRIRYKILLTLVIVSVVLMASLYLVADTVMINSITTSENKYSSENAVRFVSNLNISLLSLNNNVNDWAKWDDTYQFMEGKNPSYVELNMLDDSFENLRLNILLCYDTSRNLYYGKSYDLANHVSTPLTSDVAQKIANYTNLFADSDSDVTPQGIVLVDDKPVLVAAHPILTSLAQGPSQGTLIMGRFLDSNELASLSMSTGLPVAISIASHTNQENDFAAAKQHLSPLAPIYASPINGTTMAGYALLNDLQGNPAVIVRVVDERVQYEQGKVALSYISAMLVAIGIVTLLIVAVLLDRIVLSKLSQLNYTVNNITNSGDNGKRVDFKGDDELASLSRNINGMLDVIDKNTQLLEKTVQKRTEDLYKNQEKMKTILSASPDAIVAIDVAGNITECNNRMVQLSGYSRTQLIGNPFADLVYKNVEEATLEQLKNTLAASGFVRSLETTLLRSDQTQYPAELSANVVKDEQGAFMGYVAIIRDISERKQMEQRLVKSERLAVIGELAAMVGHDLRNPLTAIKNAGYVLKKKCSGCPEPRGQEMIGIIDKSIVHSDRIINDLLEYAREVHLQPTECSIKQLLNQTLVLVSIPNSVKWVDETTDLKLMLDGTNIIRVFTNLVRNSVDAMPRGGTLQVSSSQQNGNTSIAFADTGIGISPEEIPKLFTPLYTTKAQGMGFGLAVCKRIVEAHGGQVSVKSTVGKGTVFTLTFPDKLNVAEKTSTNWIIEQDLKDQQLKKL